MRNLGIAIGCFLLVNWTTAMAEDMECGTHMISEDEIDGQTKSEVSLKCGEPDEKEGNDWYYEKDDGSTYKVHFNDDGELESITTQ